jgi:hypothetical protein
MCTYIYTGVHERDTHTGLKSRISIYQANKIWRTTLALSPIGQITTKKGDLGLQQKAQFYANPDRYAIQLLITTKRPGTMRFSTMLVVPTWMVLCTNRQYRYS